MAFSAVLLIIALVGIFFVYILKSRPRNFPAGPPRFPIVGSLLSLGVPPHLGLRRLRKQYGDIYSLYCGSYPGIVLNNLNLIKDAFNDDRFSARPPLRPFLERSWGVSKGLIFGTGKQWVEQRKFSLQVFREFGFGNRKMESAIMEEVLELIQELKKTNGELTPVNTHCHTAIVNTLWTIVAGKRFDYDDEELHKLIHLTSSVVRFRSLDANSIMPYILFFQPVLTRLFPGWMGWNEFLASFKAIFPMLQKYIDSHKETYDENNIRDMIDVYLKKIYSMSNNEGSSFYKDDGERSLLIVLLDLFVAGGETASSNLTWAILYLTTHATVQDNVHREIDDVIGANRLPSLSDRQNMPYLEAFLSETLRMATIGAMSIFHSASEYIPDFHGYSLPKDTIVFANFWEIHHDEKIWGDPQNFRPERFLGPNAHMVSHLNVFSKGKRFCPGEGLARDELFLFLAGLLQAFKFSRDESEPSPCLDPTKAATLRRHTSKVFCTPRK